MKSLKKLLGLTSYITQQLAEKPQTIDGHIHLFDAKKHIDGTADINVGFIDINLKRLSDYEGNKIYELYQDYIKNYYNKKDILLAAGTTAEQVIKIFKRWPKTIKGFGEFKLYDKLDGGEINVDFAKLDEVEKVCRYLVKNKLSKPIYIHYSLLNDKRINKLTQLLSTYWSIPIVLCHCGFSSYDSKRNDEIYQKLVEMSLEYPNLWLDLSYTATDYFNANPNKICNLPQNRIIWGSDLSPLSYAKNNSTVHQLKFDINNTNNIKALFNLK